MTAGVVGALAFLAVWLVAAALVRERRRMRLEPLVTARLDTTDRRGARAEPPRRLRRMGRRIDVILVQLADAVSAIAAGTRSGLSLPQAVELVAESAPEPLGHGLREMANRIRLGAPLEQALDGWVAAMPAPEVRLAAGVLRLHRAVGGGLAPTLDGLARTLRERRAAVRELRSLTAQARLSGAILGLLPLGFFGFLWAASRGDMLLAVASPAGRTAIAVGLALDAAAFVWIRRLLRVDA